MKQLQKVFMLHWTLLPQKIPHIMTPLRSEASLRSCPHLLLSSCVSPLLLVSPLSLCTCVSLEVIAKCWSLCTPSPDLMRISVVLNMKSESRLRAINTQPLLLSVMKQSISLSLSSHTPVSCLSIFSGIVYWLWGGYELWTPKGISVRRSANYTSE